MGLKDQLQEFTVKVLTDPRTIAAVKEVLGDVIAKQVLPLLPLTQAAAIKGALDDLIKKLPGVEGVVDATKALEAGREVLNQAVPDWDTGIKIVDDVMDWWRPKAP